MNKKLSRILPIFLIVVIIFSTLFAFSGCSYFTSFVESIFGKEETSSGNNGEEQPLGGGGEQNGEMQGTGEENKGPEYGNDDNTGINNENPENEADKKVTITSTLEYDKASHQDLTISANHADCSFYSLVGIGLNNESVRANVSPMGRSSILVDGEYLCTLDVGNYNFYYSVIDSLNVIYYEPFVLTIKNTDAQPENVKIDYDIKADTTFVTWHCDCGGKHEITFDKTTFSQIAREGASSYGVICLDKSVIHTASVKCVNSNKSSSISKPAPLKNISDQNYLTERFEFLGKSADKYIEDEAELVFLLKYLAYSGNNEHMTVGVATDLYNTLRSDAEEHKTDNWRRVIKQVQSPWVMKFSYAVNENNICDFNVTLRGSTELVSSGYTSVVPYDKTSVNNHAIGVSTREDDATLPIDSRPGANVRNTKELLAVVSMGYKPIFDSSTDKDTIAIYNKARKFCIENISDDTTTVDKLLVMYDYLAGEINYDYSVLALFEVVNSINRKGTVSNAKAILENEIAATKSKLTEKMKTSIQNIINTTTTMEELTNQLDSYLSSFSAFDIDGVFNDGTAVCEGISEAYVMLARIEGIECIQVTGYAVQNSKSVAHAWNKVKLGDKWYCIDATWGNVTLQNEKYLVHSNFLQDEATFIKTHVETDDTSACVEYVANGKYDYFTNIKLNETYDLQVNSYAELVAIFRYYYSGKHDSNIFMEFTVADGIDILKMKNAKGQSWLNSAILEVVGSAHIAYVNDGCFALVLYFDTIR